MSSYRERVQAGEYEPKVVEGKASLTGGTGAPAPEPEAELEEATLAELKEQAEALGLPTYGTKAELRERIAAAGE